jgi:hypothetical protein
MFVAGPYRATYAGNSVGVTERGFEVEINTFADPIIGDNMADTVQDEVYTGANVFVNLVLQEYNAVAARSLYWPFHATFGRLGLVGRMKWDLAGSLVLTGLNGSRAYSTSSQMAGPTTITFSRSILAANFPVRMLFAARHRNIPLRLQAYPDYTQAALTPVVGAQDDVANAYHFVVV